MANPVTATSEQLAQLHRARELAREKRIVIVREGFDPARGCPFFTTSSYSQPHAIHQVYVHDDRLECDCPRSDPTKGNTVCTHRAVVHDELVRRQFMARAAARAYVAKPASPVALTAIDHS